MHGGRPRGRAWPRELRDKMHAFSRRGRSSTREFLGRLEVAGLGEAILDFWDAERDGGHAEPELRLLNQVVDSVIGGSSERYLSAWDRRGLEGADCGMRMPS